MDDREKIIKETYRRFRGGWDFDSNGPLRLPTLETAPVSFTAQDTPVCAAFNTLTFEKEYGRFYGQPAARIICEGVVVNQWLL